MSAGRLAGKRALVTGASSGIGKAISVAFGQEGAAVAACGRDPERTEATRSELAEGGAEALAIELDVSVPEQIERAVATAAAELGGLEVIVNCAGISEADGWVPMHEQTLEGWERTLAVNVTAAFLISKAALPHLLEAGGGAFLHVSSIAAEAVLAGNCSYGVSKAALNQLSNHIAVEYAERGIRSNTIMPGEIETPASVRAIELAVAAGTFDREALLARYPTGAFGKPEEIAQTAVFLCSEEAPFLTGACLPVDGAYTKP